MTSQVSLAEFSSVFDKLWYSRAVDWVFKQASEPEMTGASGQFTGPIQEE